MWETAPLAGGSIWTNSSKYVSYLTFQWVKSGKAAAPGGLQEGRRKQGVLSVCVCVCLRMANDVDKGQTCWGGPQGVS